MGITSFPSPFCSRTNYNSCFMVSLATYHLSEGGGSTEGDDNSGEHFGNIFVRKKWQYFFISCKVAKFESFQQSRKLSAPCSTPSCSPSKSWLSSFSLFALGGQSLPHYYIDIYIDIRVVPNLIKNPWFQKWTKKVEDNGAFWRK